MNRMQKIEAAAKKVVRFIKSTGFRELFDASKDGGKAYFKYSELKAEMNGIIDDWKPNEVYERQREFFNEVVGGIDEITRILHSAYPEEERDQAVAEIERIYSEILEYDGLNWFSAVVTLQVRLVNVEHGSDPDAIKEMMMSGVDDAIRSFDCFESDAEGDLGTHEWIETECEVVPSP